ncbi:MULTISPECIES: hypothetical protein [Pseudomonas]|nr:MULTISPECIES: hypothetical protein [Pseudomonas]MBA6138189.1 hypothetical protein [Pseudomonas monteilii]MCE0910787.1 hypothetical protein [Pseudomonas kurunegalensis]MDT3747725.1 hypothetical protein [Pseudomonas kurunegalensis]WJR57880.1 hypothetical protein LU664_010090 [Pseudomonas kurunegalensis]
MSSVDQRLHSLHTQINALASAIAALQHQVAILLDKEGQRVDPPPTVD